MTDIQNIEEQFSPKESLQVIADMIEKVQNDKLRKLARKRVGFKQAVAFLSVISLMLIAMWYFTGGVGSYFWPAWPLSAFIFVIVVAYMDAYLDTTFFSEDKEYERLKSVKNKLL